MAAQPHDPEGRGAALALILYAALVLGAVIILAVVFML